MLPIVVHCHSFEEAMAYVDGRIAHGAIFAAPSA